MTLWLMRVAVVCVVCVVAVAPYASGYKMFQQKLPNGGNVPGVAALGHERPDTGGPNNDFGLDFIESMFKWSKELCKKDSDGDGQTNGQELGDPCCEFEHRKMEKVRWTEGVSHPGDAELKSDPKLWEGILCGEETAEETEEPKATEAEETEEEEVEETQLEADQNDQLTVGAPMMRSSVMLSAAALMVMVVYLVSMRMGRRSTRNLPIFRQRRGPM